MNAKTVSPVHQDQEVREIAFFAGDVPDMHTLIDGLRPGVLPHVVATGSNGMAEVAAWLGEVRGLDAIHVVAHGEPGQIRLGTSTLSLETFSAYAGELATLRDALADDARVFVYGCSCAATSTGARFVEQLGRVLGADIVATTRPFGARDVGGSPSLDYPEGLAGAAALAFSQYAVESMSGTLATFSESFDSGVPVSSTSSFDLNGFRYTFKSDGDGGNLSEEGSLNTGAITAPSLQMISASADAGTIEKVTITETDGTRFEFTAISWDNQDPVAPEDIEITGFNGMTQVGTQTLTVGNSGTFSPGGGWIVDRLAFTSGDFVNFLIDDFQGDDAPNADPLITLPGTPTFDEDSSGNAIADSIDISDGDTDSQTVTLTASDGTFNIPTTTGLTLNSGAYNSASVDFSGTLADVNTALDSLTFTPNADFAGTATIQIDTDDGNGGTDSDTLNIAVDPVNDPPTLSATASDPTFTEGASAAGLFTGTSTDAVESGQSIKALELTVTNVGDGSTAGADEVLNLDGTAISLDNGSSGTTSGNSMDYSVSLSGGTATVTVNNFSVTPGTFDSVIDAMTYQNNSDAPSDSNDRVVTLTDITDDGGTANGGSDSAAPAIASTVSLTGVNDPPAIGNLGGDSTELQPGTSANIDDGGDATVSNVDSADYNGGSLTITDNGANNTANGDFAVDGTSVEAGGDGTIAAGESIRVGGVSIGTVGATHDGQGGNALQIDFNADADNARIQTLLSSVRWGAAAGTGSQTFTATLNDADGTTNGGDQDATANFTMELGTAPTLGGSPADATATEDTTTAIDLSAYTIDDAEGDMVTLTLAVDAGTIATTDGDGTTGGVTIANSGTASMTLQGIPANLNTYLNDVSKVEYTPVENSTTAATLTVTPSDALRTGTDDTVTISITAVNDAPSFTVGSNQSVGGPAVGGNQQTVNGFIDTNTFDPGGGETGQSLSDFLVSEDSDASNVVTGVDIQNNGDLVFTPADGVEGTATIAVQVQDDGDTTNGGDDTSLVQQFDIMVDTLAPTGQTISADDATINATEAAGTSFTFSGAETGTTYDLTVTSDGGAGSVTDSGSVTGASQQITGIDVSSLPDGTLTYSVKLTDSAGNQAAAVTDTATLDTQAPSGHAISADDTMINATEASGTSFTFSNAEVGANYSLTVTSDGGGGSITDSGSVTSANQQITGIDVSSLNDGTLTYSVDLGDGAGNTAGSVTDTATLDTTAPGITSVSTNVSDDTINDGDLGNDFTITVDFGEAMNQAVDPSSIAFPGEDPTSTLTGTPSYNFVDADTLAITYANADLADANEVVEDVDITLNGIEDAAGNSTNLNQTDVFSIITRPAPAVASITSTTSNGSYGVGDSVNVTVTFDTAVDFAANGGTLAATLSNGETVTLASSAFTGQTSVSGTYSINEGESDSADLDVMSIDLTGSATLDDGTLSADLAVPTGNGLADNQDLVIDANTPNAPTTAPDLLAADDSGTSNSDDLTNVTDPTVRVALSGTNAVAGDSVEVLVGGSALATTATLAAGDVSNGYVDIAISDGDLGADGSKSLTARVTDAAGNVGAASAARSLTLDTSAPGAPGQADLASDSDTGASNTDDITSENSLALSGGGALANETVRVSSSIDGVIGTTTADGAGNWSLTTSALDDGDHAITVTSTDAAGNTSSDSTPLNVTVDTTAPAGVPTISTPIEGDGVVNAMENADVVITGAGVAAGATVDVTIDDSNGTTAALTQQVTADGSGDWTLSGGNELDVSGLDEGTLTVSVVQTDTAGNTSSTATQSLTHDTTTPGIVSVSTNVTDDTINDGDLGNDVTITVDFDEAMNQAVDPSSIAFPSEDPTSTLTGTPSYHFVDGDTLAITYANADLVDANEVVEDVDITLNGVEDAAGNSTSLTQADVFSIITQPAPAVASITSTNSDGHYGVGDSVNVTVTFDRAVDFAANGGTLAATLSNGETVTLASSAFTGQSSVSGSYSISEGDSDSADLDVTGIELTGGATLDDGPLSADLAVPAGNGLANDQDLVIDANTPDVSEPDLATASDSGPSDSDNITNIITPTITGTTEANASVAVRVGGSSVGTVTADGSGDWSYTFANGVLTAGSTNAVDITASDAANTSADSADLTLTVDVTPPTANNDSGHTASESATANTLGGMKVTANDAGAAGAVAATELGGSNGGLLDVKADGTVSFDANGEFENLAAGQAATTSFQVVVHDLAGNRATASLDVDVQGENDEPLIATNSGPSVQAGQSVTVGTGNLNEGDPDDDGAELTYTLTSAPGSGTLFLSGTALAANDTFTQQDIDNGNLSFSAPGNAGTVTFDFTLSDGGEDGAGNATGSLAFDVTSPPPPDPDPDPDPDPNEDEDLFDGDDQTEADNDIDTGLDQTNDFEDTTIDGAPGTTGTTTDRDTGESVEVTVVDRMTGGGRQDDNDATEDVDVEVGNSVRASLSENLGLIATRRTSDNRDNVRTVIDRDSASGGDSGIDEAEREAFLGEAVRAGERPEVVEIIPTRSESSNGGVDGEQERVSVAIGLLDDNGDERTSPLVVVDSRNLGGGDSGGGSGDGGATINISGSGSVVVRGSGTFQGNEERSPDGGGPDVDNVLGDNTNQVLFFGPGHDTIRGAGGDDMVSSAGGNDRLYGGAGDDSLTGAVGVDRLNGGSGVDTVDYSRELAIGAIQGGLAPEGVMVNLSDGLARDSYGGADILTSIENAEGTVYADRLRGDSKGNVLAGHGGEDFIHGGGGADDVVFSGRRQDYHIVRDHARTEVRAKDGSEVATVVNAETLVFDDGDYAVKNSDIMASLATLYQQVLGRQADLKGFQYWSDQVTSGTLNLGEVVLNFLSSEEFTSSRTGIEAQASPAEQVEMLYEQLLGRSSDASGKAYWLSQMNDGVSLAEVALGFVGSSEMQGLNPQSTDWNFRASVENAEETTLRGDSTANVLTEHEGVDLIHGGGGADDVVFAGYMADYDIVRDHASTVVREKETGEAVTVVNAETLVFDDGDYSLENSHVMAPLATFYRQVLGRNADLDGFQYWSDRVTSGDLGMGEVAVSFLSSEEFTSWQQGIDALGTPAEQVEMLYEQLLGRSSDASGKAYWMGEMNSGVSVAEVAQSFVDSAEMEGLYAQSTDWDFIV